MIVLQASVEVFCRLPSLTYLLSLPPAQVLIMTHEVTKMTEMEDYFTKKFYPILPMFMIGRSYKMEPTCKPNQTLYDTWTELVMHSLHHVALVSGMGAGLDSGCDRG